MHNSRGMTLIELVIVLALLAGLAGMALTSVGEINSRTRYDETSERLDAIRHVIVGDGVEPGRFVQDMGRLPYAPSATEGQELVELFIDAMSTGGKASTAYSYTPSIGAKTFSPVTRNTGYGWNGPYLDSNDAKLFDGFGNRFQMIQEDTAGWHDSSAASGKGIVALRSLGADGVEGSGSDWADQDIVSEDFDVLATCNLTVRILMRGRSVVDNVAWESPEVKSAITNPLEACAYAEGAVYIHDDMKVFRVKTPGTIAGTGSATWDTAAIGSVTSVTGSTSGTVEWEYIGNIHQYVTAIKGVVLVPDPTDSEQTNTKTKAILGTESTDVSTISFSGLPPGMRWLYTYAGLVDNLATPTKSANCFSSGLIPINLRPGENVIVVYLTKSLN